MAYNNDDNINAGNVGTYNFCWSTYFPSPRNHPSPIPLVRSFQEINKNMPGNTAFLAPVIASRKRRRPFEPASPSRTTLKEKGSNKREWSSKQITQLINL